MSQGRYGPLILQTRRIRPKQADELKISTQRILFLQTDLRTTVQFDISNIING